MNDTDRALWCDNDEGLYRLMRASKQNKRAFVRANRELIDRVIKAVKTGQQPAHFLAYPSNAKGRGLRQPRPERTRS